MHFTCILTACNNVACECNVQIYSTDKCSNIINQDVELKESVMACRYTEAKNT